MNDKIVVQKQDNGKQIVKSVTHYNKQTLEFLVYECKMTAVEIAKLYCQTQILEGKITPKRVYQDLREWRISPEFLSSKSVVGLIDKSINDFDKKIEQYEKSSGDAYKKIKAINQTKEDFIKEANRVGKKELRDFAKAVSADEMSMSDIIRSQQKDETLRIAYYKAKQVAIEQLLRAREVELKAINLENILTIIFTELKNIDLQQGSDYANNFHINIKKKMTEVIGNDKVLDNTEIGNAIRINYIYGNNKTEDLKKIPKQGRNLELNILLEEWTTKYNVHYQVALKAYSMKKKTPVEGWTDEDYINAAKPICAKIYSYLDENGQMKKKESKDNTLGVILEEDTTQDNTNEVEDDNKIDIEYETEQEDECNSE